MYIRDKRIKKEIEKIIKNNLVKGHLPTSTEVLGELSEYIATNNLNLPLYKFSKIYKDFSLDKINEANNLVVDDLETIFDCITELYKNIEKQIDKFETEKRKFEYLANKYESELVNLAQKRNISSNSTSYIENFSDMENIDQNLSTCDIDLKNNEVTLKKLESKIYDSIKSINVNFEPITKEDEIETKEDILEVINISGVYWKGIIKRNKQMETKATILIDLGKETEINKLELNFPLLKEAEIEILISTNLDEWLQTNEGVITNKYTCDLSKKTRYIKLILTKEEADKFVNNKFEYHFIIDTIRIYKTRYALESVFISKPIKLDKNISKVSLIENCIKPHATNIEYYVALNDKNPEWFPINPINGSSKSNTVIDFNTVDKNRQVIISLNNAISKDEYELKQLSVNGQKIFTITPNGIEKREIIRNSLYKGVDSWKVQKIVTNIDGYATKSVFIDNLSFVETYYKPITKERQGLLANNDLYSESTVLKYSTTLECPNMDQVVNAKITCNYPVTIYLNGEIIYKGNPSQDNNSVTYAFRRGINTLDIIINVDSANSGSNAYVTADLNFNLSQVANLIYADKKPLRQVSLFNLKYNTNNQKDVYALVKTSNGYEIFVKDDDLTIKYLFRYDCIREERKEMLVKAVMKREYSSINVTPKLKEYEIKVL